MKKTHEGKKTFPYLDFDLFRQKNEHNSVILHATDLGKVSKFSSGPILSRSNNKEGFGVQLAIFSSFPTKTVKYSYKNVIFPLQLFFVTPNLLFCIRS